MKLSRWVIGLALLTFVWSHQFADAVTIRDDKLEADYIAYSTDPRWEAAGVYTSTSTCAASGATLIHPEWAITAGHCLNGSADFVLGADRSNPDLQVDIVATARNPGYTIDNVANGKDLALTQLAEPVLQVTPMRLYRGSSERGNTATMVGYGYFGTGISGDNMGGLGIRRALENRIDVLGGQVGFGNGVMLTDFDNPNDPSDSSWGPSTPLPLEGAAAFYDSGSGSFIEVDGVTYLAGVTSFRYSPATPNNPRSKYGDWSGATRVSRELAWIDGAHDLTQFWDQSTGNWNDDARWLPGAQPDITNAAVIDGGVATVTDAGEIAKYTFVVKEGELRLQNNFASFNLLLRDGGRVEIDNSSGITTFTGNLQQESDGTLAVNIRSGTTVGSGYDQLFVSADAELAGTFEVVPGVGYDDPLTRGTIDEFVLLVAGNRVGTFDEIQYANDSLDVGINYVGNSSSGDGGMFRIVSYDGNQLVLENYLALSGDANGDGSVDTVDYNIWSSNRFQSGDWTQGDFTGDGLIDGHDLLAWNANKFTSVQLVGLQQVPVVPEPGALVLLLCGCVALVRRLR